MSDYLKVAVITTATTEDTALAVLSDMLDLLFEDYELGFRSGGGVMRLAFNGRECQGEQYIDEEVATVADLDSERLTELAARHQWLVINASFGLDGVRGALDINLFTIPTLIAERPACAVAWLDAKLYRDLYDDDDDLDIEAAERLRALIVALGANDRVDGFHAARIDAFADIATFDTATLRDSLLHPRSIAQLRAQGEIIHGIVTGISRAVLSSQEIETLRATWADSEWFETINGFLVMNNLVPIPDDLDDEDEPDNS
jgi:hypothetical protein